MNYLRARRTHFLTPEACSAAKIVPNGLYHHELLEVAGGAFSGERSIPTLGLETVRICYRAWPYVRSRTHRWSKSVISPPCGLPQPCSLLGRRLCSA